MNDRRRLLAVFLFPLTVRGFMLLAASTSKQMTAELRWPVRAFGMLLGDAGNHPHATGPSTRGR
jgi:hypothetical protein